MIHLSFASKWDDRESRDLFALFPEIKLLHRESVAEFTVREELDVLLIAQSLMGHSGFVRNYGSSPEFCDVGYRHAVVVDTLANSLGSRVEGDPRYLAALRLEKATGELPFQIWCDAFETINEKIAQEDISAGIFFGIHPRTSDDWRDDLTAIMECRFQGIIDLGASNQVVPEA